MQGPTCFAAVLLAWSVGVAQGELAGVVLDDFAGPQPTGWQVSGSPEYYRGGFGTAGLACEPAAADGRPALRAAIHIAADATPPAVWLTRQLDHLPGLQRWEKLTFRFKLSTTAGLAAEHGLVCRLRTSRTEFTDLPFAEAPQVHVGEWQDAVVRLDAFPEPRNIYKTYFDPLIELTFRFGAAEGQAFDGEFRVAALTLHPRAADAPYAAQLTPRRPDGLHRALLVTHSAASFYFVREALETLGVSVDRRLFRGLHFPIFGFPASRQELFAYDLVALVDVDPYVLTRSQVEWLCDYTASGGGLLFVGGPNTLGESKLFAQPLADLLPVMLVPGRALVPVDASPEAGVTPHPILSGLTAPLPPVTQAHALTPSVASTVLLTAGPRTPLGWGLYTGGTWADGSLGYSDEAHSGRRSACLETRQFYVDPQTGEPAFLALKLLQGDSDGYSGARAYVAKPGAEYRFAFWFKGDVPEVTVGVTCWTTTAALPADRAAVETSLKPLTPTAEWQRQEGTFTLPATAQRFVPGFQVGGSAGRFPLGSRLLVDDVEVTDAVGGPNLAVNPGAEEDRCVPILTLGLCRQGRVAVLNGVPGVKASAGYFFGSGAYRTLLARTCQWLAGQEPTAQGLPCYAPVATDFPPAAALERERFFPIISWLGTEGGGHLLDERALRERVDDLWEHGFNTIAFGGLRQLVTTPWGQRERLRDYAARYAQSRGMALIFEYEHLTDLSAEKPPTPCVFAPGYRDELAKRILPWFEAGRRYERAVSVKVIDEPSASDATLDYCELCQAEFQKRFGQALRRRADLPATDREGHRQLSQFISDYVAAGYQALRQTADSAQLPYGLLLTYMSPGYGYSDPRRSLEDALNWSRAVNYIDFDVYPYFYPTSQSIRMLQAHFCFAVQRAIAAHLGRPAGFYIELDDRNYPFQVNPAEASAECAWTAVAQGCQYLNSFINVAFDTGCGARPERWDRLGQELVQIRAAGPDLRRVRKTPAELALYFPYAQWLSGGKQFAPHYAYQLLLRAFGECDIVHEQILLERGGLGAVKALAIVGVDLIPDAAATLLRAFLENGGLILGDETTTLPASLADHPRVVHLAGNLEQRFRAATETPDPAARADLLAQMRAVLDQAGLTAQARADHEEVETSLLSGDGLNLLITVNHAATPVETTVRLSGRTDPLRLSIPARSGRLDRL
jgi:uncharacterized membrane protein